MARMGVMLRLAGLFYAISIPGAPMTTLVVYESGVDAYREALAGVGSVLDVRTMRTLDLNDRSAAADLTRQLAAPDTRLVIAIGSRALTEVADRKPGVPVVATMVLQDGPAESAAGLVALEVPFTAQLETMRALLPRASRVGIIRSRAHSYDTREVLEARARKLGFKTELVDCDGPAHLLKALASLKGKVDFVLCFPDAELYNAVTIKPLILASLQDGLPVVGFSPAFVRAGAAAGIYPDYREMGRQAAAMGQRLLRHPEHGVAEEPDKLRVAVNQRVARLLGVNFQTAAMPVEVMR